MSKNSENTSLDTVSKKRGQTNKEEKNSELQNASSVKEENSVEKKTSYEKSDSLPKSSWLWIKDSSGTPSVSATFATVAFWVTTLAYVLSIFESYGQITFRPFDVAACSAYLIPILTLYFSRRWSTDRLNIIQNQNTSKNSGEKNNE
jgi:hypothetical protein